MSNDKCYQIPNHLSKYFDFADSFRVFLASTALISIMYANNEIGSVQPIEEIGKSIRSKNKENSKNKIYFHIDAVQAVNYLDVNVNNLGVDLMTLSAQKIYGPKGVGALYVNNELRITNNEPRHHRERKLTICAMIC